MGNTWEQKLDKLDALAAADETYRKMLSENSALERRFDAMVGKLDQADRDLAWDFVMQCEDMSRHVMKLACMYMDFKEQKNDIGNQSGTGRTNCLSELDGRNGDGVQCTYKECGKADV